MTTVISTHSDVRVISSKGGLQGPPGPGSGGGSGGALKFNIAFGDVTQRNLYTMPSAGRVQSVSLDIDTPWNGSGPALSVGSLATVLHSAGSNDPASIAIYETEPGVSLASGTEILFFNNPGAGCTQGAGVVVLNIILD